MADCIGTGFPQFFCALVQIRYSIVHNGCGHILKGGSLAGRKWKNGKKMKRAKGKRRWGCIKGNSHTGETTSKKKLFLGVIPTWWTFPYALVQMRYSIVENGYGDIFRRGPLSEWKLSKGTKARNEHRGNGGGDMYTAIAMQVELRIKKNPWCGTHIMSMYNKNLNNY